MYGLVDCNNFYASCERIFRPDLASTPIVVLSNNDGCVIARSREAKKMGIAMGAPYYKIAKELEAKNVEVFSSNYPLYGSISARVVDTLESLVPNVEIYSIDEAFISTAGIKGSTATFGKEIVQRIKKWVGMDVCVGFAETKTLAKLANHIAKDRRTTAVFTISEKNRLSILSKVPVSEIWGIGRKSAQKLHAKGVFTALDLHNCHDDLIRRLIGLNGLRTAYELRGQCAVLENPTQNSSIGSSRSFGKGVTSLSDLNQALACYVDYAYKKLKKKNLYANAILVYIATNRHNAAHAQYSNSCSKSLLSASNDLSLMMKEAKKLLTTIYREGFIYNKVGVVFYDLVNEPSKQLELFENVVEEKVDALSDVMEKVEDKIGRNALFYASKGITRHWQMRQEFLSHAYTTRWDDILTVKDSEKARF